MARKPVKVWVQAMAGRAMLQLQWHDPATGRRRTRSAGTSDPAEAKRKAADLEYEFRHGLHAEPSAMSWEAFVEAYLAERMSGMRAATRRKAAGVLTLFGQQVRKLADVDARAVSRHVAMLRGKQRAPATIKAHLDYLAVAFRWAVDQELLVKAPKIERHRVPKVRTIRTITREEFERLLAACENPHWPDPAQTEHWRRCLWCAWHTGMRRSEMLELRWEPHDRHPWIDFAAKRIRLPAASNKANADQWVPIHPELLAMFEQSRQPSGWVFPLSESAKEVSRRFGRIAKAAGVDCTMHDLRRTFGSRFAPNVPAQILQRLMRHADIATTMEFYAEIGAAVDAAITAGDTSNAPRDVARD